MVDITLRKATNSDIPSITRLVKKILPEFDLAYDSSTSDSDIIDIEKSYDNNGGIFMVVENNDGNIIGTVALFRIDKNECVLRKMYLARDFRGKGLGKILMANILQKAANMNFQEITLETNTGMTAAIHLYEQFGFRKIEVNQATSPRCNLVMKRSI